MIHERSVTDPLLLDDALTLDELADVALRHRPVELADAARGPHRARPRSVTDDLLARGERVYGLTTGVGALKRVRGRRRRAARASTG